MGVVEFLDKALTRRVDHICEPSRNFLQSAGDADELRLPQSECRKTDYFKLQH